MKCSSASQQEKQKMVALVLLVLKQEMSYMVYVRIALLDCVGLVHDSDSRYSEYLLPLKRVRLEDDGRLADYKFLVVADTHQYKNIRFSSLAYP